MILVVDIGNSNIVIALYKEGSWTNTFRYETKDELPEFYYESALRNIFLEWSIHPSHVKDSIVSSVVPDLNLVIREAILNVTGYAPILVTPEVFKLLDMHIPHPYEIGTDLVANAYGALHSYGNECIIVDFGTALSFTIVSKAAGIIGVTIAPGLKTAIHSLSLQTAQLPMVPIQLPSSSIGNDTVTAIQAGVMWGYVGLVKQLIASIQSELNGEYKIIATGGLSSILSPLESEFDYIDKMLTLNGLRLIYSFIKK